ncbi:MAG: hypothetical protein ACLUAR_19835 [Pilosibacter sp.]
MQVLRLQRLRGCGTGSLTVIDSLKMIAGGKVSTNDIAGPVRIVTIGDPDGGGERPSTDS